MDDELESQIQRIKIAKIKLDAEIKVGLAMVPDDVAATIHYDGKEKAMARYPEYANLIRLCK